MSRMQYERILTGLEQRLAETGLYDLPGSPTYRKRDNLFLKLIGPAYTSLTCSACGQVHSTNFYESILPTLRQEGTNWSVTLPDGNTRTLPEAYKYYVRNQGMKSRSVDERIQEIIGSKTIDTLSATAQKSLLTSLRAYWLPYRPTQAEFQCVSCGHKANADLQGSLNIARKFIYTIETKTKGKEDSEKARRNEEKWNNGKSGTKQKLPPTGDKKLLQNNGPNKSIKSLKFTLTRIVSPKSPLALRHSVNFSSSNFINPKFEFPNIGYVP